MYRKKGRGWTKHIDFMLIDIACIVIAFFISYVIRFGFNNPYVDKDYRILGVAFLLIDFFVEIMADSFKNVIDLQACSSCIYGDSTISVHHTDGRYILAIIILYHVSNLCDNNICSKTSAQELP